MVTKTARDNDGKTQHQLWKEELESLKSQKNNKSLPPSIHRLIEQEIETIEDRLGKWDTVSETLRKTEKKIEEITEVLSNLRKTQRECETFLGITTGKNSKRKSKFNPEEVVAFIKKNGGTVTYEQIAKLTGIGVQTIKKQIGKVPQFKVDTSTRPHTVTLK